MNKSNDQRIYEKLCAMDENKQNDQPHPIEYGSAFMVHLVLKLIPLGLYFTRNILYRLIGRIVVIQLVLIFVVVDFWFTKNITGRKMIGLKWGFEQDPYGVERLRYESRVNDEYTSSVTAMLFWIVLIGYCVIPFILIGVTLIIAPNLYRVRLSDIMLNVAILIGGGANLFFYLKAKRSSSEKKSTVLQKLGKQFARKMGAASIVSYR